MLVYLFQDKRCDGEMVDGLKVLAYSSHNSISSGCMRWPISKLLAREPNEGMVIHREKSPLFPFFALCHWGL